MNKYEFIDGLKYKLNGLPYEDIERSVEYYSEMIDDLIEEGMSEENAVNLLGDIDIIAEKIKNENMNQPAGNTYNVSYHTDAYVDNSYNSAHISEQSNAKKHSIFIIILILLFFGLPVWLPVLSGAVIVIISVLLVLYIISVCFAATGVAGIAAFIMYTISGSLAYGVIVAGVSLIVLGFSVLMFIGSVKVTTLILKLVALPFKKLSKSILKRRQTE